MKLYTITRELVSNENCDEIYSSDLVSFIFPEFEKEYEEDYVNIDYKITDTNKINNNASYSHLVSEIKIDKIKELINNAEKSGATHVGIFYHEGHQEYEVYGYNIHAETTEERMVRLDKEAKTLSTDRDEIKIKLIKLAAEHNLNINFE